MPAPGSVLSVVRHGLKMFLFSWDVIFCSCLVNTTFVLTKISTLYNDFTLTIESVPHSDMQ